MTDWTEDKIKASKSLINAVLSDWDLAMDRFFNRVDRERVERGLTETEVWHAMDEGYGFEVAEAWSEWTRE